MDVRGQKPDAMDVRGQEPDAVDVHGQKPLAVDVLGQDAHALDVHRPGRPPGKPARRLRRDISPPRRLEIALRPGWPLSRASPGTGALHAASWKTSPRLNR